MSNDTETELLPAVERRFVIDVHIVVLYTRVLGDANPFKIE